MTQPFYAERYRVIEKIGSGGMADVYRAEDTTLSRPVALKVLHRQFSEDEDFITRFKREAQAAANLTHPNIVSIYDWGSEDSTYFIVMEYVRGTSLKELIQVEGALPPERVVDIAKQVCAALQFAHSNGVVHRDVKPHNIVLTPDGTVKVTDFGIARQGTSTMTQTGAILGSAHYLSPEQAQGRSVDATSDLYSLGVVLYEMATGRVPFDGENPVAVALKHVHGAPVPPRHVNAAVPASLEAVILRAMAKNAENRYQSADEVRRDLTRVSEGLPVSPPPAEEETMVLPPPRPADAGGPPKRRRSWVAWLALALTLLVVGLAGGWALYDALTPPPPRTVVVPDLRLKTYDRALTLAERAKLKLKKAAEEYSDTVPKGQVIDQEPGPGTEVKEGGTVLVTLSLGREYIVVPDVKGETGEVATSMLIKKGLDIGELAYEASDTVPPRRVIEQFPEAGESVPRGTKVNLTVSTGPSMVTVPDVQGKPVSQAQTTLQNAGLKTSVSEEFSETVEKGRVTRTIPPGGTEVRRGSSVTIWVSKGPELVTVPDVKGKTEAQARSTLEGAGLVVAVEYIPGAADATVMAQNPEPGTQTRKGTTVTIYVGQPASP